MNLYVISQTVHDDYDTYDSAIVAAETEDEARNIHPADVEGKTYRKSYSWCDPQFVQVKFLCAGYEGEKGVILSSFNAG